MDSLLNIPYIHKTAATIAFKEMAEEYLGPELLNQLEAFFRTYCLP